MKFKAFIFCLAILIVSSCVSNPKVEPQIKAVDIKDSQVETNIQTQLAECIDSIAKMDAIVKDIKADIKASLNSYEQKSNQNGKAGRDINNFNLQFAGGGAALVVVILALLYSKLSNKSKALNSCMDAIEKTGHNSDVKQEVQNNAKKYKVDKYLSKIVKNRYKN